MRAKTRRVGCLAAGALLLPVTAGAAEEDEPLHRISLQVESSREVSNDWVRAVVAVEGEDVDPAKLAGRVNETMAWALEKARARAEVRARSGGYGTHPVYEQGRLRRWRASQQLVLESADVDAVSALVGELQARLRLKSLNFTVSPQRRRQAEDELIVEVLQAFQARAMLVRETLGAASHEIVKISIHTSGTPPPQPMRQMAMAAEAGAPPPALEAGTSRVVVRADGTIELD